MAMLFWRKNYGLGDATLQRVLSFSEFVGENTI
jgi:hypothetical protein